MIDFGFGVALDRIQKTDLPLLLKWRNDRRIWKWCRQNDVISPEAHQRWFERQEQDPTIKMYAIKRYASEEKVRGVCGLTSIDMLNRTAEFSLYVDPDAQKQGTGKQALQTLFEHGFKNLGLHSIWGETFEGNHAARMFEAIGMKKEGTRREHYYRDGHFLDCHLYSLLRNDRPTVIQAGSGIILEGLTTEAGGIIEFSP